MLHCMASHKSQGRHWRPRNHKGYEEVLVPAVKAGAPAEGEVSVRIEQMEDWAQLAFEGYKCAPGTAACPAGLGICLWQ